MGLVEIETLESRTLLSGVILATSGRLGTLDTFVRKMADDITAKLGGPAQVPQYVLTVDTLPDSGVLAASIRHVDGTGTPQTSNSGEIFVSIDYNHISANASYDSTYIGQVAADFLTTTPVDGVLLASLPIHEIALSRGTAIMDGIARELGQSGVWVDQETYLDPNPIGAQGDPNSTIYDNVAFVENYWRNDGVGGNNGEGNPVDGAYNLNVNWINTDHAGWEGAHQAVSGYYVGTIDLNSSDSGWGTIYNTWYGNTSTMPARDQTGYIYTDLVGGARPLDGVWTASGGAGVRTATTPTGSQWGNVADLAVTTGNAATSGQSLGVSYIQQDRDSSDTVTFFLDTDRNPYNGSFAATLGSATSDSSSAINQQTQSLSLEGVTPGTYWVGAQVTDAQGHTRYTYSAVTSPLTVQGSAAISGTVFNDVSGAGGATAGEPGLAGRVVYVDFNGSGTLDAGEPSATTDADGNYRIGNLAPDKPLTVREVVPVGQQETAGVAAPLTLSSGKTQANVNFATTQLFGGISGTVFNDLNGNGIYNVGEPGLPGRVVYVDLDGSGPWKPGDPIATTDATGAYSISGVPAGGAYTVREVVPGGQRETTAPAAPVTITAASVVPAVNFATSQTAAITGSVFLQGVAQASSSGAAGGFEVILTQRPKQGKVRKFVSRTAADGSFSFAGLQPGARDTVQIVARKGFKLPARARTSYVFTPAAGQVISGVSFSQVPLVASKPAAKKKA